MKGQRGMGRDGTESVGREITAGEEGHAQPGWTTSRPGQDSPWKSQSE